MDFFTLRPRVSVSLSPGAEDERSRALLCT